MWESPAQFRYKKGDLFIGNAIPPNGEWGIGYPLGIATEKHAITIASARTGKGAAIIIPNLLRWPHSALVVDPKGEAAEATALQREKDGHTVYVLDPMKIAKVPKRLRTRLNLLSNLDPKSSRIREDINVIADGLLMRHDPKSGFWDGGGLSVIAGVIAHVLTGDHNHPRTLPTLRKFLTSDRETFARVIDEMQENDTCGNLAKTAASKLTKTGSEAGHFLSVADENTKWLDSEPMADFLNATECNLRELKISKTTIYLVLPVDLLEEHGRFLRLFVRAAISAMAQRMPDGSLKGEPCLFLLDEFAALGHISEISKAAGLMPGYGVHLWPFLQDIGQLVDLYGHDGAHTFFGNADLHQFFGSADKPTLEYISAMLGVKGEDDFEELTKATLAKLSKPHWTDSTEKTRLNAKLDLVTLELADKQISRHIHRPRLPPDAVAAMIAKTTGPVAKTSINIIQGHKKLIANLAPYFLENQDINEPEKHTRNQPIRRYFATAEERDKAAALDKRIAEYAHKRKPRKEKIEDVVYGIGEDIKNLGRWFVGR